MDLRRGRVGRWAVAVLLGCVTLLVIAPSALATEKASGKIEGDVTAAKSGAPLGNIAVVVFEKVGGKEAFAGLAFTEANGSYTVEDLPAGEYYVEFSAEFEDLNYVTQYYNDAASLTKAEPVKVSEGGTKESIDAAMEEGAEIAGTVTDASTHKTLANALVVALGPDEVVEGAALTNSNGQYTIEGLVTSSGVGSYRVGFADTGYVVQYYNDQSSFALANPVAVTQGSTTSGIGAALMPKAPIDTAAPVVSGTPAVGETLSCTDGSWTGTPAPTFAYSWLRDGVAISGATASTYVVQTADVGNGLTCKVTATNKSGSAAAVSNTLIVPVPPPPPPMIEVPSSKFVVSGSFAEVPVVCAGATCTGTIELTGQIVVKHRKGKRTISRKQTVVIAKGTYSLAAGTSTTVAVRLTAAGKSALAVAKAHKLPIQTIVLVAGGKTATGSAVLSGTVTKSKKHKGKKKKKQ